MSDISEANSKNNGKDRNGKNDFVSDNTDDHIQLSTNNNNNYSTTTIISDVYDSTDTLSQQQNQKEKSPNEAMSDASVMPDSEIFTKNKMIVS